MDFHRSMDFLSRNNNTIICRQFERFQISSPMKINIHPKYSSKMDGSSHKIGISPQQVITIPRSWPDLTLFHRICSMLSSKITIPINIITTIPQLLTSQILHMHSRRFNNSLICMITVDGTCPEAIIPKINNIIPLNNNIINKCQCTISRRLPWAISNQVKWTPSILTTLTGKTSIKLFPFLSPSSCLSDQNNKESTLF